MSRGNFTQKEDGWTHVGSASRKGRKEPNRSNPNFDRVVPETKEYTDNVQENPDKILIRNLQERTKMLEEQIKQFENRIKILEDQMKNLQCTNSTVNDVRIVPSVDIKQNTANKSNAISSNNSDLLKSKIDEATNIQQIHSEISEEHSKNKCETPNDCSIRNKSSIFSSWMNSRKPNESLWSDGEFRRSLLSYINKIYKQKDIIYRIFDALQTRSNSLDELDQLYEIIKRLELKPGAIQSLNDWREERSNKRSEELEIIFEYDTLPVKKLEQWKIGVAPNIKKIIDTKKIKTYFDLICRDGATTAEIGQYLKLGKAKIFGGNDYDIHNDNVTFVKINLAQSTIDLADNTVDLITCLVTLHHVHDLNSIFGELIRILKPGGYLILREHDCKNEYSLTMKYLNFVHAFMMIARIGEFSHLPESHESTDWTQLKAEIIDYTSSIQYHARDEWREMLERVGFQWKATVTYAKCPNPQKLYYSVFQLHPI